MTQDDFHTRITLTGIPSALGKSGAEKDVGDGLEVGLVTVLVRPDRKCNCSQVAHFLSSVMGCAPTQSNWQGPCQIPVDKWTSWKTDGLNVSVKKYKAKLKLDATFCDHYYYYYQPVFVNRVDVI